MRNVRLAQMYDKQQYIFTAKINTRLSYLCLASASLRSLYRGQKSAMHFSCKLRSGGETHVEQ
jgi:hypothetical protein